MSTYNPDSDLNITYSIFQKLIIQSQGSKSYCGNVKSGKWTLEFANDTLMLLNWISFCLVSDATNQSIAASLVTDPERKVATFLLSTNVPITDVQLAYTDVFFTTLLRQIASSSQSESTTDEHHAAPLLSLVTEYAWKRVHRKAMLVNDIKSFPRRSPIDNLRRILNEINAETDGKMVIEAMNCIIALTPSLLHQKHSIRYATLVLLSEQCKVIISSRFLDYVRNYKDPREQRERFIFQFHRRVHRLYFYLSGTYKILDRSSLLSSLHRDAWTINYKWIQPISRDIVLPSPFDFVRGYLCKMNKVVHEDVIYQEFQALRKRWQRGETTMLRVHAEARMARYLAKRQIVPVERAIGCSKRVCRPCAENTFKTWDPKMWLGHPEPDIHNDVTSPEGQDGVSSDKEPPHVPWLITQYSGKLSEDWMFPNIKDQDELVGLRSLEDHYTDWKFIQSYDEAHWLWAREPRVIQKKLCSCFPEISATDVS